MCFFGSPVHWRADALERIALFGGTERPVAGETVEQPQPSGRVRWVMSRGNSDPYLLANVGTATAHRATIAAHESLPLYHVPAVDLGPAQMLTFMAVPSLATSDRTITVSWTDDDGTAQTWKYPLPAG